MGGEDNRWLTVSVQGQTLCQISMASFALSWRWYGFQLAFVQPTTNISRIEKLFIYLFDNSFTPNSRTLHLCDGRQHCGEKKPSNACSGKPTGILRLLQDLFHVGPETGASKLFKCDVGSYGVQTFTLRTSSLPGISPSSLIARRTFPLLKAFFKTKAKKKYQE